MIVTIHLREGVLLPVVSFSYRWYGSYSSIRSWGDFCFWLPSENCVKAMGSSVLCFSGYYFHFDICYECLQFAISGIKSEVTKSYV